MQHEVLCTLQQIHVASRYKYRFRTGAQHITGHGCSFQLGRSRPPLRRRWRRWVAEASSCASWALVLAAAATSCASGALMMAAAARSAWHLAQAEAAAVQQVLDSLALHAVYRPHMRARHPPLCGGRAVGTLKKAWLACSQDVWLACGCFARLTCCREAWLACGRRVRPWLRSRTSW